MILRKIVPILTALFTAVAAAAIPVPIGDNIELQLDRSDSGSQRTIEEFRAADRQIATLFRTGRRARAIRCRVVTDGSMPPGELAFAVKSGEWELKFNDREGRWLEDFNLRRRLFGLLLLARTAPAAPPENPDFLPGWLAAGIDARLQSARESERLQRRNRRLPLLRALCEDGRFPSFRQLRAVDPASLPPAVIPWYRELGRVMLDLGALSSSAADNALLDYALLAAAPGRIEYQNFDATLGRVFLKAADGSPLPEELGREAWQQLPPEARVQRYLEYFSSQLAWNEFFPQPPQRTLKQFNRFAAGLRFPELDREGKPTGKDFELQLESLPEVLAVRPDAAELRNRTGSRLMALAAGNDTETIRRLSELNDRLMALPLQVLPEPPPEPTPATAFRAEIGRFREFLNRKIAIEAFLDATEESVRIPAVFHRNAIEEALRPSPLLTREEKKFFDRVEADYLED